MMAAIEKAGIDITQIGEVLDSPVGVSAKTAEGPAVWPTFAVDEIARLFKAFS
jgi:hypothetical protein